MKEKEQGFVSLVGAGPGDPGLLTLAGRARLELAEAIVYDRLANPALLDLAPKEAERVFAGKSPEHKALSQPEINQTLVAKARLGLRVVRLKGGDPFVFGRGGEEALALREAGIPFDVVPGVTSAIAAPAYAGVPVTHRGLATSFAVVTGHEDDEKAEANVDWQRLATAVDTVVILMGAAALAEASRELIAGGREASTPAVSIEWGTTNGQRSVLATLSSISKAVEEAGLGTPLLTVVGEVAGLREQIGWFEEKPLLGKKVLVTRTRLQASALSERLRAAGAIPVELPTLELVPTASKEEMDGLVSGLAQGAFDWCFFTSTNAVEAVFEQVSASEADARIFAGCRLAAVGEATAEMLRSHGLTADLLAKEFSSGGLLQAAHADSFQGKRVLLPRAGGASPELVDGLKKLGADLEELVLYKTQPPSEPEPGAMAEVRARLIEAATFASSSSVRNLASLLEGDLGPLSQAAIACIGPATAKTAEELGLKVSVMPETHTIPALVRALEDSFRSREALEA